MSLQQVQKYSLSNLNYFSGNRIQLVEIFSILFFPLPFSLSNFLLLTWRGEKRGKITKQLRKRKGNDRNKNASLLYILFHNSK